MPPRRTYTYEEPERQEFEMPHSAKILIGLVVVAVLSWVGIAWLWETNGAGYTAVRQAPFTGDLSVYTTPGMFYQGGGEVTLYKQVATVCFGSEGGDGSSNIPPVDVRFNDSGKASVYGNVRFELPRDQTQMLEIHRQYRGYQHLVEALLEKTVGDVLIQTAQMFSSEDTYAGGRAEFLRLATDQLENGKFQTDVREEQVKDPVTEEIRRVRKVTIRKDAQGNLLRAENPLARFGIKTTQLVMDQDFKYEEGILDQIQAQRKAYMQTATARTEAAKAQQEALTAEAKGKAAVTTAEYEKLVEKKRAVVEAEQKKAIAEIEAQQQKAVAEIEKQKAEIEGAKRLAVADLDKQAAEKKKQELTLLGEGEAARKKLVMEADGALEQKLMAWTTAQQFYARAIENYRGDWVPKVVMASGQKSDQNGALDLINLLSIKAARDLALDMSVFGQASAVPATTTKQK